MILLRPLLSRRPGDLWRWAEENEKQLMAYELDNLDGMQRKSFNGIDCGDIVKLVFRGDGVDGGFYVERMWVKVIKIGADGFIGALDNDPYHISNLKSGDLVQFSELHILEKYES